MSADLGRARPRPPQDAVGDLGDRPVAAERHDEPPPGRGLAARRSRWRRAAPVVKTLSNSPSPSVSAPRTRAQRASERPPPERGLTMTSGRPGSKRQPSNRPTTPDAHRLSSRAHARRRAPGSRRQRLLGAGQRRRRAQPRGGRGVPRRCCGRRSSGAVLAALASAAVRRPHGPLAPAAGAAGSRVAGASSLLAYVCLFYAFEHGRLTIAVPIMSSWAVLVGGAVARCCSASGSARAQLAGGAVVVAGALVVSRYAQARGRAGGAGGRRRRAGCSPRWARRSASACSSRRSPPRPRVRQPRRHRRRLPRRHRARPAAGAAASHRPRAARAAPPGCRSLLAGLFETAGFACIALGARLRAAGARLAAGQPRVGVHRRSTPGPCCASAPRPPCWSAPRWSAPASSCWRCRPPRALGGDVESGGEDEDGDKKMPTSTRDDRRAGSSRSVACVRAARTALNQARPPVRLACRYINRASAQVRGSSGARKRCPLPGSTTAVALQATGIGRLAA